MKFVVVLGKSSSKKSSRNIAVTNTSRRSATGGAAASSSSRAANNEHRSAPTRPVKRSAPAAAAHGTAAVRQPTRRPPITAPTSHGGGSSAMRARGRQAVQRALHVVRTAPPPRAVDTHRPLPGNHVRCFGSTSILQYRTAYAAVVCIVEYRCEVAVRRLFIVVGTCRQCQLVVVQ
jgi:hypothetical protein